jgi:hypothetical protein
LCAARLDRRDRDPSLVEDDELIEETRTLLICSACKMPRYLALVIDDVGFCFDCRERACAPADNDELGIGG